MRFDKPQLLALVLSLFFAIFILAVLAFLQVYLKIAISLTAILVLTLISFLLFFVSIRYAVEQFIYQKVKIIYKNIHELKVGYKANENKNTISTDLDLAALEVAEWADESRKEIKELRTRENFRREFIGNISHELKTPIFNIQGYLLTLLDGALDDEEINRRYLKRANKSVDRMIAIIEDLEVIADLEGNRVKLNMKHYDLADQIRDVFELLENAAKKRNIKLTLKADKDKVLRVRADKSKLEQVLINLIGNAVKYGNEKAGYVEVAYFDMEDKYLIEISDNGLGIPDEDLPRVFERFYRVDKSRSREAGGTGLGLSIVKHIIESHKQTVNVRSSDEVGSTFSFTLQKAK
jgi:two-component system phosphate regulon sensor histidine kinase PhoR